MGTKSDTLEVDGFLVRVTAKKEEDRMFLYDLRRNHPEVFDKDLRATTIFIIKNTGLGLFVLEKVYERFQPFCSVQALVPFSRWMIPEKIKEVSKKWKKINQYLEARVREVKYEPKIIAISKSE
jgi:hypothetical protein